MQDGIRRIVSPHNPNFNAFSSLGGKSQLRYASTRKERNMPSTLSDKLTNANFSGSGYKFKVDAALSPT